MRRKIEKKNLGRKSDAFGKKFVVVEFLSKGFKAEIASAITELNA